MFFLFTSRWSRLSRGAPRRISLFNDQYLHTSRMNASLLDPNFSFKLSITLSKIKFGMIGIFDFDLRFFPNPFIVEGPIIRNVEIL